MARVENLFISKNDFNLFSEEEMPLVFLYNKTIHRIYESDTHRNKENLFATMYGLSERLGL